jgi:hypothetical protein
MDKKQFFQKETEIIYYYPEYIHLKKQMLIRTFSIIVIILLSIFFFTKSSRSGSETSLDTPQIVNDSTAKSVNYTKRVLTIFFREVLKKAF